MIFSVQARESIPDERVFAVVAHALDVAPADVGELLDPAPRRVRVEITRRGRGFVTGLEIYFNRSRVAAPSEPQFAKRVAADLQMDVLTESADLPGAPHRQNPFSWLLVRPDGSTAFALSDPDEDDRDNIVIDEAPGALTPAAL